MLNSVVQVGRLTRDPELRYTPSGKAVCNFRLAVDRDVKGETDFFDVVVWDKQGESVANHLQKGRMVAVKGRLQSRSYEDKEGKKREKIEIVAERVRFLDRPEGGADPGDGPPI